MTPTTPTRTSTRTETPEPFTSWKSVVLVPHTVRNGQSIVATCRQSILVLSMLVLTSLQYSWTTGWVSIK